jgi:3-hydroxyacyl-[acyl-carrier-protein] dehydratase
VIFRPVDRILEVRLGERIVAAKSIGPDEFLPDACPSAGRCLPFALVIECLAQAGGHLVSVSSGFRHKSVLGGIQSSRPGRPALVGGCLELVAEVEARSDDAMLFRLRAACEGDEVAAADGVLAPLLDCTTLEDPAVTRARYDWLRRSAKSDEGAFDAILDLDWAPYDAVEEMVVGERARASKLVRMPDPLFDNHFPRFPVVPGVLAMHSLICLSEELLAAEEPTRNWQLEAIHATKFHKYIRPHDRMVLETRILDATQTEMQLSAAVTVDGKHAVALRRLVYRARE